VGLRRVRPEAPTPTRPPHPTPAHPAVSGRDRFTQSVRSFAQITRPHPPIGYAIRSRTSSRRSASSCPRASATGVSRSHPPASPGTNGGSTSRPSSPGRGPVIGRCVTGIVRVCGVRARNRDNRDNRDKPAFSRGIRPVFLSRLSAIGREIGTQNRDTSSAGFTGHPVHHPNPPALPGIASLLSPPETLEPSPRSVRGARARNRYNRHNRYRTAFTRRFWAVLLYRFPAGAPKPAQQTGTRSTTAPTARDLTGRARSDIGGLAAQTNQNPGSVVPSGCARVPGRESPAWAQSVLLYTKRQLVEVKPFGSSHPPPGTPRTGVSVRPPGYGDPPIVGESADIVHSPSQGSGVDF
jgi:hypothetical protein